MFFRRNKKTDISLKKGAKRFDKLMTGVIIGGAVGSVLGATLSDKDKREQITEKGKEFVKSQTENIKDHIQGQKQNKKSTLNKFINIFRK